MRHRCRAPLLAKQARRELRVPIDGRITDAGSFATNFSAADLEGACRFGGSSASLRVAADAGDWPQILGPHRDGRAEGESLSDSWPAGGPKVLWERPVGRGYAGVAIVGERGVLFHRVENEEVVEAFDVKTGKSSWKFTIPTSYVSGISPDDGPRCVPIIHGDRVIVFGVQGNLACLRLADGAKIWAHDTHAEYQAGEGYFGAGSSPIVEGDKVIVNVGGAKAGAGIVAFSLESGKPLWKQTNENASYSSPIAVTVNGVRHVIVETRLTTVSLNPDNGAIRFEMPFGMRGPTVNGANPTVVGDRLFMTASYGIGARLRKNRRRVARQTVGIERPDFEPVRDLHRRQGLTSDKFSQSTLWEMATYDIKPRLNRQTGVSSVIVQGGQVPEFEVKPDPAKLVQTGITISNILDAVSRSNMIDSPGLIEANHQLILSLVSGQTRTPEEIGNIVIKTTPAGAPVRIADVATVGPSVMPVYTVVTANAKPAVLLNINRQPAGNTVDVANAVHAEIAQIKKELPKGVELRPFYDQSEIVKDSITSVRDAVLLGLALASLIMVLFLRDWGTSLVAGLVIPATIAVTFIALRALGQTLQPDDARRPRGRGRLGDRRRHRRRREHRHAPRFRPVASRGHPQRHPRDPDSAGRFHHHADCGLPAAHRRHRRQRRLLPRAGRYRRHGPPHLPGAGAHLDSHAQPLLHPQSRPPEPRRAPHRSALVDECLRARPAHNPRT